MMILRILDLKIIPPFRLDVTFNDGTRKVVNVLPLLNGHVFAPLQDPEEFARGMLDPICGTITWPNGADLAPEALHVLPAVNNVNLSSASTP